MGGLCSRSSNTSAANGYYDDRYDPGKGYLQPSADTLVVAPSPQKPDITSVGKQSEKEQNQLQDQPPRIDAVTVHHQEDLAVLTDDFYDGIPRYSPQKSRSVRSRQAAVIKVSEVSSLFGRAGTVGFGKAVAVLDTLGSSMTNLNSGSGFVSAPPSKGNEIGILAFEIANTIVKGFNLMQSLSKRSIRHLKDVVLPSKGVQLLVSKDMHELLKIVAADKRMELKIFMGEVVRFGNRCKDPQWHNLDRYFEKISRELIPQKQLTDQVDLMMQQIMALVHNTAEVYHELHALDRFEQDYQHKCQEEENVISTQRGDNLGMLKAELKSQRKLVKNLKKKSLWSKSLEEVIEKLVDIVQFLHLEIQNVFGIADGSKSVNGSTHRPQRLGPAGLALHYANIVIQVDTLVARSSSVAPNTRDALYQNLPPNLKSSLRSKLQSFHVKEELTVAEIKAEMEKTLEWLVPMATNTAKAHHGFGWVGEWASTGSEVNRKTALQTDITPIETLHHADKEDTESCVLELVMWLHHLVMKSKSNISPDFTKPVKSTVGTSNQGPNNMPTNSQLVVLTTEDQQMLQDVTKRRKIRGISKSEDFDTVKNSVRKHIRLTKSSSHSPKGRSKELLPVKRYPSGVHVIDFSRDLEKALDVIDRVDKFR